MGKSDKIKLAIVFPAYGGQICAHHAMMWLELGVTLASSSDRLDLVRFGFIDVNPVDRARNIALAEGMKAEADWLLTIDADTWVQVPTNAHDDSAGFQLLRMISEADHAGAALVVAPVYRRPEAGKAPSEVMAYRHQKAGMHASAVRRAVSLIDEPRGLVPIDSAATACMAINLHATADAHAIFAFTPKLSEDLEFCRQIQAAGGKILLDTRVRTGHLSRQYPIYSDEDYEDEFVIDKTDSLAIATAAEEIKAGEFVAVDDMRKFLQRP